MWQKLSLLIVDKARATEYRYPSVYLSSVPVEIRIASPDLNAPANWFCFVRVVLRVEKAVVFLQPATAATLRRRPQMKNGSAMIYVKGFDLSITLLFFLSTRLSGWPLGRVHVASRGRTIV